MHKIKVTIYHVGPVFESNPILLNKIEAFIGSTTDYWELIEFEHYRSDGKTEVIYNVKPRSLITFKEAYTSVLKNSSLNLSKLQFKYLEE